MPRPLVALIVFGALCGGACRGRAEPAAPAASAAPIAPRAGSFDDDVTFLRGHTRVNLLASDDGQAVVAIAPDYQGRVMTSTAAGGAGDSFGYLHRPGIESGQRQPHMTVLGGEDRLWLGPEGGQYGLYFPPHAAFDTDHWQVPEPIDWGSWTVVNQSSRAMTFRLAMNLTNYSGARFDAQVDRTVRLLDRAAAETALGHALPAALHVVAYESDNLLTNVGSTAWRKETGLLSIWILGQYRPSPRATVVLPIVSGAVSALGSVVNDAYFGAIPPGRLHASDAAVFLRADGRARGKIGIPRPRARDVAGSYDPDHHLLTIVQFSLPAAARDYVNSLWSRQAHPYGGDVVNSYNDGPLGPGLPPLGPFYEIESSSPAAALAPKASLRHVHRTIHLQGDDADLDAVARAVLGVSLGTIANSLPPAS